MRMNVVTKRIIMPWDEHLRLLDEAVAVLACIREGAHLVAKEASDIDPLAQDWRCTRCRARVRPVEE